MPGEPLPRGLLPPGAGLPVVAVRVQRDPAPRQEPSPDLDVPRVQELNEILHDDMKHIILGHLSAENNYPALAFETVCCEVTRADTPYKAADFDIGVAKRDEPGQIIEW